MKSPFELPVSAIRPPLNNPAQLAYLHAACDQAAVSKEATSESSGLQEPGRQSFLVVVYKARGRCSDSHHGRNTQSLSALLSPSGQTLRGEPPALPV